MEYDPKIDYVGPQGKWYKFFIPRVILGIDFNYPSYDHDLSYKLGICKVEADLRYLEGLLYLVEKKDWKYLPNFIMRQLARIVALIYYIAVREFGKDHFNENPISGKCREHDEHNDL